MTSGVFYFLPTTTMISAHSKFGLSLQLEKGGTGVVGWLCRKQVVQGSHGAPLARGNMTQMVMRNAWRLVGPRYSNR
jgi:hypothetical protein